ncbi:hypothetical protein D9613_006383 [Agrocybe pediades]|uniref:Peptidase M43 pregnancy-associated plasma-A domain-containing protein n=1 Tax=Agrocybe pediades TaxID=84607 RepID=A0A8H4QUF3_9AGAR|nr:hypothetical protein D9613_006383 [Agrocybe pediades]
MNSFNTATASLSDPSTYYRNPKNSGVMIQHSTVANGPSARYNMGRMLTHEAGHWLELFHTFEGGCDDGGYPASGVWIGWMLEREGQDGPDLISKKLLAIGPPWEVQQELRVVQ